METVTETAAPAAAAAGKKPAKRDLDELKKELVMDEHQIPVEELAKRFGTDISNDFSVVRTECCTARLPAFRLPVQLQHTWEVLFGLPRSC